MSRLCDWAVVALVGEDGGPGEEAWAHRDPGRRADLDTYMTGRLRGTGDDEAMVDALLSGEPVQMIPVRRGPGRARRCPPRRCARRGGGWTTASYTIVPLRARGETFGALVAAELRRPATAHRGGDRHRRRGGPPRRAGAGQRPPLRPPAEGRRDTAAQPAHPAAAARRPADRRPLPAGRRPTSRSAATGTTPSSSPTAPPCWSSATSSGTTWTPPRRWARSAASCAAWPATGPRAPRGSSAGSTGC